MMQLLRNEEFLAAAVMALAVGGLLHDVIFGAIRRTRESRRKAAATARFRELRERLWSQLSICPGVDAETGALIARAERSARTTFEMEELARARLASLEPGADRSRAIPTAAEAAIDVEQKLQRLLVELERTLTGEEAVALAEAQAAWCLYRDRQVRMCRERRLQDDVRWPVRHYASEAVTLARIADLEDLRAAGRIAR